MNTIDTHTETSQQLLDRFIQPLPFTSSQLSFDFHICPNEVEGQYQKYLKRQLLSKETKSIAGGQVFSQNICLKDPKNQKIANQPKKIKHSFKSMKLKNIVDDFYLNLLDWSPDNILAIGLRRSLYGWAALSQKVQLIFKLPQDYQICSVKFNQQKSLAVGTNKGEVQIVDFHKTEKKVKLNGHLGRVSSIDWHHNCLVSGSRDGYISIWDPRVQKKVHVYKAHNQEVSGLKWNSCGKLIASGGNDNKLLIFDIRMKQELVKFSQHKAAIKALDWCPDNQGIIAAGGGTNDRHVRFFNSKTLRHQFSIDTGSQICNLTYSKISSEMVTTHGYSLNQINVWKSKDLWKTRQSIEYTGMMMGHSSRVLYLASSPSGQTLATAAGDQTVKFWHPFEENRSSSQSLQTLNLR